VFGPGFGEAIAVHFGDGAWMLVDSCLEPWTKQPAAKHYLDAIGVLPENVKVILASHWHDDHVRGISTLARAFPAAEFHLSDCFNRDEAVALLAAHSGTVATSLSRGTNELYTVLNDRNGAVYYVGMRSDVFDQAIGSQRVRATALSPVPAAYQQFVAGLAQFVPRSGGEPIKNVVSLKPNMEAVAIHIDFGDDAVVLGSDLEDHASFGWTAVVGDQWVRNRKKASAIKIAHHGSKTGDHPLVWTTLLHHAPIGAMTPYNKGSKLPTDQDITRIKGQTSKAYISSGSSRRAKLGATELKRLSDIATNIVPVNSGFGCVRLRRSVGADWTVECFGAAQPL